MKNPSTWALVNFNLDVKVYIFRLLFENRSIWIFQFCPKVNPIIFWMKMNLNNASTHFILINDFWIIISFKNIVLWNNNFTTHQNRRSGQDYMKKITKRNLIGLKGTNRGGLLGISRRTDLSNPLIFPSTPPSRIMIIYLHVVGF